MEEKPDAYGRPRNELRAGQSAETGKGRALDRLRETTYGAGSSIRCAGRLGKPLRHFASGGERTVPEHAHQLAERGEHSLVALPEQRGQDVLADLISPEMVPAVAARQS